MKLFEILFTHNKPITLFLSIVFIAILSTQSTAQGEAPLGGRQIFVVSTSAQRGADVTVSIELNSQGDETAASFTLSFDRFVLTNPVVTIGSGAPAGASVGTRTDQLSTGRLGVLIDSGAPFAASPPNRQLVTVRFTVAADAILAPTPISFIQSPTPLIVSNADGVVLQTAYQFGTVTITPPVTTVTIGGRVTTPSGQNLRNAVVSLIDSNGVRRLATTSSFGLYSFDNVATGRTYTLTVGSKRYRFAPRVQTINAAASNLDFVGLE